MDHTGEQAFMPFAPSTIGFFVQFCLETLAGATEASLQLKIQVSNLMVDIFESPVERPKLTGGHMRAIVDALLANIQQTSSIALASVSFSLLIGVTRLSLSEHLPVSEHLIKSLVSIETSPLTKDELRDQTLVLLTELVKSPGIAFLPISRYIVSKIQSSLQNRGKGAAPLFVT